MKKIFLIHNAVYLPLEKNWNDKWACQKYIGSSVSGNIFPDQIYTEDELRAKYANNPGFKEVDGLLELNKAYNSK